MARTAETQLPDGGKARRVYLLLKDEILRGIRADGSALPGEPRLAAEFGVSRVTIRRALAALDEDGLILRRPGSGTVVQAGAARGAGIAADFATLMPQLLEITQKSDARLLSFAYGPAPAPVAAALGLAEGGKVQTAVRLRLVDGQAYSHLTTHVPEDIARNYSEADLATTPLFRLLERGGVRVAGAEQSVTATLATPDVAEALGVPVASALLAIDRVVRDAEGRGVEHLAALYRPDMFRLEMKLSRVGSQGDRHWAPVIGRASDRQAAE